MKIASEGELKLIVSDESEDDFKPKVEDQRFKNLGKGAFALDPTDKNFKKAGTAFVKKQHEIRQN